LYRPGRAFAIFFLKIVVATSAMVVLLAALSPPPEEWLRLHVHQRVLWMAGLCALGGVGYFAVLLVAGLRPRDLRYHV
jgi:putative peptidoglycan lipid II flippase